MAHGIGRQAEYPAPMHRIMVVVRCLLLVLLIAWLLYSLGTSILRVRQGGYQAPGDGRDPGVRVLLLGEADQAPGAHPQINLVMQQTALLYCPEAREDYQLELDLRTRLQIQPDPQSGLTISGADLDAPLVWPIQRVRLIPLALSPDHESWTARAGEDFEAVDTKPVFAVDSRLYRGCLEVERTGAKTLLAINTLPIEAYLEGVLQSEMTAAWPLEALKAQAVVSRSVAWAARHRRPRLLRGAGAHHLTDGEADQTYRGTGNGGKAIDIALTETRGRVLTYRGLAFVPRCHPSSGGYTANIADVFPDATTVDGSLTLANVMPARPDPWCYPGARSLGKADLYWQSSFVCESGELRKLLKRRIPDVGWIQRITPIGPEVSDGVRRVRKVRLPAFGSDHILSGTQFRELLGPATMRSTLWSADSPRRLSESDELTWKIVTFGWGHGVGLSQVSAWYMAAERHYDHTQILDYFFSGVVLTPPRW